MALVVYYWECIHSYKIVLVRFQGLSSADSSLAASERLGRWQAKGDRKRCASADDDSSFSRCLENIIAPANIPSDIASESFSVATSGRHVCQFCGKDLHFASRLREHLRTHTGERPYQCSHCNYRATQSGSLTRHVKSVHQKDLLFTDLQNLPDN